MVLSRRDIGSFMERFGRRAQRDRGSCGDARALEANGGCGVASRRCVGSKSGDGDCREHRRQGLLRGRTRLSPRSGPGRQDRCGLSVRRADQRARRSDNAASHSGGVDQVIKAVPAQQDCRSVWPARVKRPSIASKRSSTHHGGYDPLNMPSK